MMAQSRYFRRGQYSGKHFNLANTVLVKLEEGVFCLGYLQDVQGDDVYIDFDCAVICPSWVQTRFVWFHNLIEDSSGPDVQVALRSENEQWKGAYVFQPARKVGKCGWDNLYMCYITTERQACTEQKPTFQLVHRWQIVKELPDENCSSICDQRNQIHFGKHTILLTDSLTLPAINESNVANFLDSAFGKYQKRISTPFPDIRDRLYVGLSAKKITITILDISTFREGQRGKAWWEDGIHEKLLAAENCLLKSEGSYYSYRSNRWEMQLCCAKATKNESILLSLGIRSLDVMAEILALLDAHSLAYSRRVCVLWNTLAETDAFSFMNTFTTIDFRYICTERIVRWDTKGYYTGFVLEQSIKSHTKVLALLNMVEDHEMSGMENVVSTFLLIKSRCFSIIVVKNYYRKVSLPFSAILQSTPMTLRFARRCRTLILLDFTVTIPHRRYLHFAFNGYHDGIKNIVRRFKAALNEQCPVLDVGVANQLRQLYANWLRTIPPYDARWGGFISLLELLPCSLPCPLPCQCSLQITLFATLPVKVYFGSQLAVYRPVLTTSTKHIQRKYILHTYFFMQNRNCLVANVCGE
ncbi:uncharacterized protein LOC129594211 isoform X2 [Paramacrobiotus metropolitanus]|uniref:uncharacterized protein LOC129594211 isoform X2 n=1 Tax=Paramacrobiotus metropolitanus TaxID=2943436 RepID=UPI0024463927|nr:uncharacterized protein LOC129594211 isoform X2 [Paramacrobiotus metropolitanus]